MYRTMCYQFTIVHGTVCVIKLIRSFSPKLGQLTVASERHTMNCSQIFAIAIKFLNIRQVITKYTTRENSSYMHNKSMHILGKYHIAISASELTEAIW